MTLEKLQLCYKVSKFLHHFSLVMSQIYVYIMVKIVVVLTNKEINVLKV